MKTITEASQMTQFARLRTMLIVSFNLTDNDETDKKIGWAVLQDPNDPKSPIHKEKDKGLVDLARAFNFGADGKIKTGKVAQTAEQLNTMMNLYFSRYDDKDEAADEKAIKNYQRYIGLTKNLEDFLSNAQGAVIIRNFALKAFDITAEEASSFTLKRVFTSDLSDTKSYVYTLKDERFVRLAKAFNFDAEGKIGSPRLAQSENEITRISRNYLKEVTRWDKDKKVREKGEKEVTYYRQKMETIETVDQLLSDRRLLDFMLIAQRIDPKTVTTDYLKKIFKSDLKDPKSFANTEKDARFRALAKLLQFRRQGEYRRESLPERAEHPQPHGNTRQICSADAGTAGRRRKFRRSPCALFQAHGCQHFQSL